MLIRYLGVLLDLKDLKPDFLPFLVLEQFFLQILRMIILRVQTKKILVILNVLLELDDLIVFELATN